MRIAIVTGASSGIGAEFARQLDVDGLDGMWLVARRRQRLETLAATLATPARILPIDLADPAAISAIGARLKEEKPHVAWLINNAGFGKTGDFAELRLDDQLAMVDVNVRAVTHLAHLVIPYMARGSCMVHVSSSASFQPLGAFAVYAATKAYVTSLSYALAAELEHRGIHSVAVCPGPVDTEFGSVSRDGSGREKKLFAHKADVKAVVKKALRDAKAGRWMSVFGFSINALRFFSRLMPWRQVTRAAYRYVYVKTK